MNAGGEVETGAGRPRILLVTEFFPISEAAVYGAVQRLLGHLDALRRVGMVDVAFLWPEGYRPSPRERGSLGRRARAAWKLDGRVTFVAVGTGRRLLDPIADLFWGLRGAIGFFHQRPSMAASGRRQARALRLLVAETSPDLIFAHRIGAAAAMLRAGRGGVPMVFDLDDLEHVAMARRAERESGYWKRQQYRLWSRLARHAEKRIAAASACVLVCSELDRATLAPVVSPATVRVAPNAAQEFPELRPATGPVALFVGTALYGPNREAIGWLAREIWPWVRKAVPEARLLIAGEGSSELTMPEEAQGIELLGFVSDLRPLYESAAIVVCPVRHGGGTRIKIIEAAINGRAVVSTTIGVEGLEFVAGSELLIADTAEELAGRCADLLTAPARAAEIAAAARRRARALYSRDKVAGSLADLVRGYVRQGEARP